MNIKKLKNSFFINTSIIILTGFLIKILGLINKIIITRFLGTDGMSIYIMTFPTIILLLNISTLNINNSVSKLIAESKITNNYSPKIIIQKALKITTISSISSILLLLIFIKPLTTNFLKNQSLLYPILTSIILIPITCISDIIKGYYNGFKKITKTTTANILEQISRIIFTIFSIIILKPFGIIISATFTILALSIGELISMLYLLFQIKKDSKKFTTFNTIENNPTKELLSIAIPSTLTKLIGSFTYFLEPIVYTFILTYLEYDSNLIQTNYTIINAYTLPLLTTASFISAALSTTVIPSISENYALKKMKSINYLIDKVILFSFIPSILVSILLFFYPNELMKFIYGTTEGTFFIKPFVFFFLLYYLQMPFNSILQAINKTKIPFLFSSLYSILRILLIIVLSFIPSINVNSIFYAILLTMLLHSITIIILVIKYTNYQININNLFSLLLITFITIGLLFILKQIINSFLINSLIISIIYLFLNYSFNLIDIKSLKKS